MDDDVPLCALVKGPKLDDDTPLAALAGLAAKKNAAGKPGPKGKEGAAKAGRPSSASAAPKRASSGAPGAKRKRDESSSSSSSSSSSGSDSSSDDDKRKKPRAKAKAGKGQKMKLLNKKKSEGKLDDDNGSNDEEDGAPVKLADRNRSTKEKVVADFLCRWWYVMEDWPPNEPEVYAKKLDEKHYREVALDVWEWVKEVDEKGRKKCYQLSQFRGTFRDSAGNFIDLRPKDTCPSYQNMMKKDLPVLQKMLVQAYENQIKDLEKSTYDETHLKNSLTSQLTRNRDLLAKYQEVGTR